MKARVGVLVLAVLWTPLAAADEPPPRRPALPAVSRPALPPVLRTPARPARPPMPAVGAATVQRPPGKQATRRRPARKPKPPAPPAGPRPDVKLALEAPTTQGPWTMRVTNDGDVPVLLDADARLLALEVTPRGERKPVRCELPADMRPADDLGRSLVLPPKRSYAQSFEPRLYCFGDRLLDALAPDAIVVARLGWPGDVRDKEPFEIAPIDGVEPVVAPLKSIESAPVALPDEPTAAPLPAGPEAPIDSDAPRLTLTGARAVDAASFDGLLVPVALHDDGSRTVIVRFRPETLAFEVVGPSGVEHCAWPLPPAAAMRDLFTRLPPGGTERSSVALSAYCHRRTFDRPGLYVVRPELDTRHAGGEDIALRTFDGRVIATVPTVVRVHQGTESPRLERPRLEPQE